MARTTPSKTNCYYRPPFQALTELSELLTLIRIFFLLGRWGGEGGILAITSNILLSILIALWIVQYGEIGDPFVGSNSPNTSIYFLCNRLGEVTYLKLKH